MRRSLSLLTTTASLLLGATCLTQAMAATATAPQVVVRIVADDLSTRGLDWDPGADLPIPNIRALARAGTSTRLRLESAALNGADTFKLVLDAPTVELTENAPAKTGKSGLFADLQWAVHKGTDPEIYLVNDVASY